MSAAPPLRPHGAWLRDGRPDAPKTLASAEEREFRRSRLQAAHMRPLSDLAMRIRERQVDPRSVPDFDPLDGGVEAEVLFLLEAPGPRAVQSGFVSRNNPDETAKNFFLSSQEAGIERRRTLLWNVVPWYVGEGGRIRPVRGSDVAQARDWLEALLALLPGLRIVVFVGRKAALASQLVVQVSPGVGVQSMPHPSPVFVNRSAKNRSQIVEALRLLAQKLDPR